MKVEELVPGMVVVVVVGLQLRVTFVAACPHPLYDGLAMVVWRNQFDGEWMHDALSWRQDVLGEVEESTVESRRDNLQRALLHPSQWNTHGSGPSGADERCNRREYVGDGVYHVCKRPKGHDDGHDYGWGPGGGVR